MILEGIVTTRSENGQLNVAPMGPIVDRSMQTLLLRPFQTSTTYQNLRANPVGVFHVVDDVLLIAEAALGKLSKLPKTAPAEKIDGDILLDACRWYEFRVTDINDREARTELSASIVHTGRLRDVFGFNRAMHAVIEAAILATRLHLLDANEIERQLQALRSPLEKTGSQQEFAAFELIENHVKDYVTAQESPCRT